MELMTNDTDTMCDKKESSEMVNILDDEELKQKSYLISNNLGCDNRGKCPPIDIEFVDLTYTVPIGRHGK